MLRESEVFVYYFDVLILLCCRWEFSVVMLLGMNVFLNAELLETYNAPFWHKFNSSAFKKKHSRLSMEKHGLVTSLTGWVCILFTPPPPKMVSFQKRKYENENRGFRQEWGKKFAFIEWSGKHLGLICNTVLYHFKASNLKRCNIMAEGLRFIYLAFRFS